MRGHIWGQPAPPGTLDPAGRGCPSSVRTLANASFGKQNLILPLDSEPLPRPSDLLENGTINKLSAFIVEARGGVGSEAFTLVLGLEQGKNKRSRCCQNGLLA